MKSSKRENKSFLCCTEMKVVVVDGDLNLSNSKAYILIRKVMLFWWYSRNVSEAMFHKSIIYIIKQIFF